MRRTMILILLASVALGSAVPASAQSDGGYDLTWWTVDNGGNRNSNGGYTLRCTIGQPDAGLWQGGGYTLVGGFWPGDPTIEDYNIYLPIALRNA